MKKPENPYVFVADALYRFQKMSLSMYFSGVFLQRRANEGVNIVDLGSTSVEDCLARNDK